MTRQPSAALPEHSLQTSDRYAGDMQGRPQVAVMRVRQQGSAELTLTIG
jgi:hypothetical protein